MALLSFLCRRAPCRGRGEGVCFVLARFANPATTLVCQHRVARSCLRCAFPRLVVATISHNVPLPDLNNLRELSRKLLHGPQLMLALTAVGPLQSRALSPRLVVVTFGQNVHPHDPTNLRELSTKLPHGPQLMLALTASRAIAVSSALPPLSPLFLSCLPRSASRRRVVPGYAHLKQ